jgi:hypothetical protein
MRTTDVILMWSARGTALSPCEFRFILPPFHFNQPGARARLERADSSKGPRGEVRDL